MESKYSHVDHLIVDSSAFLKNIQLQTKGKNIYTISEVINEIKDKATRERLQVLPYELILRDPLPECSQLVAEFSKQTGDYPSLSLTDLKLLSLTYQLTKDFVGTEHLRKSPEKAKLVSGRQKQEVVGFCAPTKDCEDDENDDEGWITPSNIDSLNNKKNVSLVNDSGPTVACMTADFAMQNVILQMGMHLVSMDGFRIRESKTFILRCFACFKSTTIMSKTFCPHCGNKTLKRVAVAVDENGEETCFISRRPINHRGTKFSLPTPAGGKHTVQPILSEDQRIPQQRQSNMSRQKLDALSPDYLASVSPFAIKDVYSRAAHTKTTSRYYDKKNPNQVSKSSGNKKRK